MIRTAKTPAPADAMFAEGLKNGRQFRDKGFDAHRFVKLMYGKEPTKANVLGCIRIMIDCLELLSLPYVIMVPVFHQMLKVPGVYIDFGNDTLVIPFMVDKNGKVSGSI